MRAVRFVRLIVGLVVLVAAMALGAASASAFSLASSTATTQAGAPTNMSFTYVATGTQSVSRLDVDLPPGMVHDPSATPACPLATFQADRCPATSRVATAATTIVVGGTQLSVPGAVFHVADAADDSDFPLGIVLRPPLSALGLTGKIFLRDRVTFTNGGGLRHSIAVPRVDVSVLGIPLRGRLQRMSLSFTGQNPSGNQLYNSTSATSQPFRATASFSDGSSESRTSPYRTTGSDKLIFIGGFDVDTASTRGTQPSTFGAKLGGSAKAPAGVTHEYHRVGGTLDVSQLGDWDTSDLADDPTCSDSEFITNTCPIRSQIGTVTTEVEGFPGTKLGGVFNSYPRGAKPKGRIQLRPGVSVSFTLDFVTGADGRASLEIDGLPQLPLTDISIDVTAPVFLPRGKPASCSNREARGVIRGHNGGQTNTTAKYPPVACPPSVTFADPDDADADGDGLADRSIRAENFQVKYDIADGGNGVNRESARCELESPDPARADKGKIIVINDGSGGIACDISGTSGDVTVVFSIASIDGHVTVLKSSYNIDSEPPVLESVAPEPIDSSTTEIALPFEFTDDRIDHPQAEYEIECVIEDSSGQRHTTTPGHKYIDSLKRKGGGECMWDTGRSGRFRLEVVVRDSGGHVTVLKRTAVVDAEGPVITLTDFRDGDKDQDGLADDELRPAAFNVPFSVFDNSADPVTVSCKLINPVAMDKGLRVADTDGDGAPDVCLVEDAPGGPVSVEITAVDWRGHVTVLKIGFTVDTDAPVIETTAPDKVVYDISSFDFEFEFTDDTASHPQSKFKAGAEIEIKAGYVSSSSVKVVTDRDTGRSKGFARFENVPDGDHVMVLTVEDSTGHVTVLKVSFTVDAQGPTISLADPRDEDSDGDGLADDELRSGDFIVPFSVGDEPGLDNDDVQCSVAQTNPAFQQSNTSGNMPDGDELFCPVRPPSSGPVLLTITATSAGGHVTVLKIGFTADVDPPVVTGLDRGFYSTPQVGDEFEVTDDTMTHPQSDYTAECRVASPKLEGGKEGLARIVVDRDSGRSKGFCFIGELPDGEYELSLRVRDKVGHVTLIKRTVQVDTIPPRLIVGDEQCDDDNTDPRDGCVRAGTFQIAVSASDPDGSGIDSVECRKGPRGWDGTIKGTLRVADLDGDGAVDACVVDDAPEGIVDFEIVARDKVGHVTLIKRTYSVDKRGPSIKPGPSYDDDADGIFDSTFTSSSFDVPFTVSDESDLDTASINCQVRDYNWRVAARPTRPDGGVDQTPAFSCPISGFPDGPFELEISAADVHGHVTVLKLAGEVDATPLPAPTILAPTTGQTFESGSWMTVVHSMLGEGPYTYTCTVDGMVVSSACVSGFTFRVIGLGAGGHVLSVTARDEDGRTATASVSFQVVEPEPDVCVAIYPPPPGCPGYIPPGGGIITVP